MRKILKDEQCISFIETNIPFKKFEENQQKFNEMMIKLTNDFIILQLYNGDKLLKYGEEKGIYNGGKHIEFKHSKGYALIRTYKHKNKTLIEPLISILTLDFVNGWTFDTGLFADVYIKESAYGYLSFGTRDILYVHNLYLYWISEQLEKLFDNYKETKKLIPLYRDRQYMFKYKEPICLEFNEYINRN